VSEPGNDTSFSGSLERAAEKVRWERHSRRGDIIFVVSGREAGQYAVEVSPGTARVTSGAARGDRPPLLEVMGDADTIRAILDGERDAREEFLQGGLRVRGDLRYFSDLAMELGILKIPL
jgi:hypothetical protein